MGEAKLQVGVVGAGAWGTALAQAAAKAGHDVLVLARRGDVATDINTHHRNAAFLGDAELSTGVKASLDARDLAKSDVIILATPAQATRVMLPDLHRVSADVPLILTAKGFEQGTLSLQSQIAQELMPEHESVILSGPSFAVDVARGRPTAVTLASKNERCLAIASTTLASKSFRPYGSDDEIGAQVAGALKNVYALAAGAVEGAGLGLSARSALIARAQAEMLRMIEAMGGSRATVSSLAGMGDLVLSCTSEQSRNYKFGKELGRGHSTDEITSRGLGLAEGVFTAPVALELAQKHQVDAPLIGAVNMVLSQDISIAALVDMLMTRPLKQEI